MLFTASPSFKRRLIITGLSLFAIVVMAACSIYLAARQYNFYLERGSHAQRVYSSYLAVSDHTYRKLSAMGEIVTDGDFLDLEERYQNQRALREALKKVRESIDAELSHVGDANEKVELDHLNEIEALAEKIIAGSDAVRNSVRVDNRPAAKTALNQLRSATIEGKFNSLIDEALEEELREVRETQRVVSDINNFATKLLPFLVLFFLLFLAILIYATWQALTRSLRVFEAAADSYRIGDFSHKIQKVEEAEFADLANALNHMAAEITSQRATERASQENLEALVKFRTQELESTNTKLTLISEKRKQFLADISHELRTPLTIIQGESDVALRGEKKTVDQYVDALSRVKEQSIHTARLIQDLLFVARTEDGKAPIHKQVVTVQPLVEDACNDFRQVAAASGIDIIENYANTDLLVNLDTGKFKQVLSILLDNAVRYSHRDSTIEITLRKSNEQAIVEVIDTGIGLSFSESSQIFSRYYRGNDGAGAPSGTGLGLPVAKAIVDAHGGTINLKGEQGKGTIATVVFPIELQRERAET